MLKLYNNSFVDLNENNYLLFAAKNYTNENCYDMDEFYADLMIPMHLKKLFTRYHNKNDLKERLIINHLTCFFNVFEPFAACKILFYKIEEKYYPYLKTSLMFLNRKPDLLKIEGKVINVNNINVDTFLLKRLEAV